MDQNLSKIEQLSELIKEDSKNFQAMRELYIAYLDKGFNEEAMKQLLYLVNVFPDEPKLYFHIGITWERLKKPEFAKKAYKKAVELDFTQSDYKYNLALLLLNLNEFEEALKLFKEVLAVDKNDFNTYFNLGLIFQKKGLHENALKCFKNAYILNNSDWIALFNLAYEYEKTNDDKKAIECYNLLIKNQPDYSWAYYNLGDRKSTRLNSSHQIIS